MSMGPLFVLLFWVIVGSILSAVGGGLLACAVAFLLRGVEAGRKRAIIIAGFLPAIGFAYLFVCVLLFSFWSAARGRDWGWGDTWDTPILGGYHLMMIDVTDEAAIYHSSFPDIYSVSGVRRLEVRAPFLIGTAAPWKITEYPHTSPETLFFILNTSNGTRQDFKTLSELESAARNLGGPLRLEPVENIYNHYRYGIVDLVPVTLFAIPPLTSLFFLMREFLRLRATRELEASS